MLYSLGSPSFGELQGVSASIGNKHLLAPAKANKDKHSSISDLHAAIALGWLTLGKSGTSDWGKHRETAVEPSKRCWVSVDALHGSATGAFKKENYDRCSYRSNV